MDSMLQNFSGQFHLLGASFSDRESHTVGGLVTARLRRIPRTGDHIEESEWRIVVEEASERVAVRLRVESTHHS
jgi:CBS domain containing-hemolysin-like protein